jgi:hypothetical protein
MATDDVSVRRIAWAGGLIAATVVLVVAAMVIELLRFGVPLDGARGVERGSAFDGPALESAPQPALQRYRREKRQLLESTATTEPGYARIPIESAMRLLSEQGLRAAPVAGGER